ncbi:uncharacterized protein LOC143809654 [Ranitomeya variabilis]|uniref:uncharacterized protein LOC143809654 n=1 Tax=Ranitomeya variabilis TaxID=490064 RepID=UPI004055C2C7
MEQQPKTNKEKLQMHGVDPEAEPAPQMSSSGSDCSRLIHLDDTVKINHYIYEYNRKCNLTPHRAGSPCFVEVEEVELVFFFKVDDEFRRQRGSEEVTQKWRRKQISLIKYITFNLAHGLEYNRKCNLTPHHAGSLSFVEEEEVELFFFFSKWMMDEFRRQRGREEVTQKWRRKKIKYITMFLIFPCTTELCKV